MRSALVTYSQALQTVLVVHGLLVGIRQSAAPGAASGHRQRGRIDLSHGAVQQYLAPKNGAVRAAHVIVF